MIAGGFAYQRQVCGSKLAQENTGSGLIDGAREAVKREDLTRAKVDLGTFAKSIGHAPMLGDLRARVDKALGRVDAKLDEQVARESRLAGEQAERERLRRFRDLRDQRKYHDIQLNGLDLTTNQASARRVARAALALFAASGSSDSWALAGLTASLTQGEQAEVVEGCYGLLLSLAEAEPTPADGLLRLDEAARLRPATMAFHLRRAACLARAGRMAEAKQGRDAADRTRPTTAFDHFLVGQERYKRGDLSAAMSEFYAALEIQPNQFWSQCLRSVCLVKLERFDEAWTGFTACLDRDDRQPWLFLLRGFSSYQLAVRARIRIEKLPPEVQARNTDARLQLDAAATDYRRAFKLLDSGVGAELRFPLLVNQGVLKLERGEFGRRRGRLERRDRARCGAAGAAAGTGAGLLAAGQARSGVRSVQPGDRSATGLGGALSRTSGCAACSQETDRGRAGQCARRP